VATKILTRDDFLLVSMSRKRTSVEVPELGGTLYLQEISTAQLLEYNVALLDYEGKQIPPTALAKIVAKLLVFSVCDADGTLMFTDADIDALAFVDINVLMGLRKKIIEVSGYGKAIEEVADDLKKAQTGSSSTSSPKSSE